jgi:hypothetical protein
MPAVTGAAPNPGLAYTAYELAAPWVPNWELEPSVANGVVAEPSLDVRPRATDFGLLFTGYLNIPVAGTYTFYVTTDTGAFIRIHEAQLLDADFGYPGGTERSSGPITLAAGRHPIRIHYRHADGAARSFALSWQGPGIAKEPIPSGRWEH